MRLKNVFCDCAIRYIIKWLKTNDWTSNSTPSHLTYRIFLYKSMSFAVFYLFFEWEILLHESPKRWKMPTKHINIKRSLKRCIFLMRIIKNHKNDRSQYRNIFFFQLDCCIRIMGHYKLRFYILTYFIVIATHINDSFCVRFWFHSLHKIAWKLVIRKICKIK